MYDVFLLILNQPSPSNLDQPTIYAKAINKKGKDREKYYHSAWPTINSLDGILYKLFACSELGSFECGDDLFIFDYSDNLNLKDLLPVILSKSEENLFIDTFALIRISEEYEKGLYTLLEKAINQSPVSTVLFLCCDAHPTQDIIVGAFDQRVFVEMLKAGKIYTNLCYIINRRKE